MFPLPSLSVRHTKRSHHLLPPLPTPPPPAPPRLSRVFTLLHHHATSSDATSSSATCSAATVLRGHLWRSFRHCAHHLLDEMASGSDDRGEAGVGPETLRVHDWVPEG